jgi:hypothetical protein
MRRMAAAAAATAAASTGFPEVGDVEGGRTSGGGQRTSGGSEREVRNRRCCCPWRRRASCSRLAHCTGHRAASPVLSRWLGADAEACAQPAWTVLVGRVLACAAVLVRRTR